MVFSFLDLDQALKERSTQGRLFQGEVDDLSRQNSSPQILTFYNTLVLQGSACVGGVEYFMLVVKMHKHYTHFTDADVDYYLSN